MKKCNSCKQTLSLESKVGRRDVCPFCKADIHCCLNCTFYDRAASKQCREPVAESVKDKQKANFCDYFTFAESSGGPAQSEIEKSHRALGDLFKR
jgi:hypothetical protein